MEVIQDHTFTLDLFRRKVREAQHHDQPTLVSITQRIWTIDPFELFERSETLAADRVFWSQPDQYIRLGFGSAYVINASGPERFRQTSEGWTRLLANAIIEDPDHQGGPILFGGFAFDPQQASGSVWQGYPDGRMVLPQIMLTLADQSAWLTANMLIEPGGDAEDQFEGVLHTIQCLLESSSHNGHSATHNILAREELRPVEAWQAEVEHIIQAIRRGDLEKAVLARAIRLSAAEPFNLSHALRHLSDEYPGCTIFAIARGNRCFLGATPERLVQVRGNEVQTMCLAGSTRRGATPDEDRQLGEELFASAKNRREHSVVLKSLTEALNEACTSLEFNDKPRLLKLGNVQHLCTPITGKLAAGHTLMELVERLHPTPAVGGRPREIALQLIREREGMNRGWYAGPVGWLDQHGEGEFAVALRSALIQEREATLFAGCGIMADSDPEREYAESCLKFRPMLSALGAAD